MPPHSELQIVLLVVAHHLSWASGEDVTTASQIDIIGWFLIGPLFGDTVITGRVRVASAQAHMARPGRNRTARMSQGMEIGRLRR